MRSVTLWSFIFSFFSTTGQVAKDQSVIEQLKGVCKVWGFLKYYANPIDTGIHSWNKELQDQLPAFYKLLDNEEYNLDIKQLIDLADKHNFKKDKKALHQYKKYKVSDYNNLHFGWIDSTTLFDAKTKERLHAVIQNFQPQFNNYLAQEVNFKGWNPGNTPSLQKNGIDDDAINNERMLNGLFTLWNLLYYTYPYNDLVCMNYDSCLATFIPQFINIKTPYDYACACQSILGGMCDSHATTSYWTVIRGIFGPPIRTIYIDGKTIIKDVPDSLEKKYHLRGCEILKINDTSAEEMRNFLRKYLTKARPEVTERDVDLWLLKGKLNSNVNLLISNGTDTPLPINLIRNTMGFYSKNDSLKTKAYLDSSVYYINMRHIYASDKNFLSSLLNAQYLILDYRDLKTDFKVDEGQFEHYLLHRPVNWILEDPIIQYPGKFYQTLQTYKYYVKNAYKRKIIILINTNDQSSDEFEINTIRCGAVNPVTLVGSNTAGACGEINTFSIYRDMCFTYTAQRGYFIGKKTFEKSGLIPDIYIEPTINGIRSGCDEVLERALQYIIKHKGNDTK